MRRGPVPRPRKKFPLRIIIPLACLVVGVGIAYSLVAGGKEPPPRPDPVIIMPEQAQPAPPVSYTSSDDIFTSYVGPVPSQNRQNRQNSGGELFTSARVAAYKVKSAELKKTVSQYAKNISNQCSGEITVRTEDTPLNVRAGPSTANPVITKVQRGSKQSVLLWAPDSKTHSGRWFLLVDEKSKTVKGWVTSEFCEADALVYAD